MRVTRWYYGMEEGVALYNTWFDIHDGRREGRDGVREPHPPGAPPTSSLARGRKDAGLSGFPMFRILPRAENVIPSEGSRHSNGSRGGRGASRGAGSRRWPPSPPPPRPPAPGSRGSAFWGACFSGGPDSGPWPLGATAPSRGRTPPPCSRSSEMFRRRRSPFLSVGICAGGV